jgi:hypothetical protein
VGGCSCCAAAAKFGGKGSESSFGGEAAPRCAVCGEVSLVGSCLDLEQLATLTIEKCGRRWVGVEEVTMLSCRRVRVRCLFLFATAAAIAS